MVQAIGIDMKLSQVYDRWGLNYKYNCHLPPIGLLTFHLY